MLKYVDTQVTFSEVPDEISLCISISNCPFKCKNCHSQYLQEDIGEVLDTESLNSLIERNPGITCICFMGGDSDVETLKSLAEYIKKVYSNLNVAWYSGKEWSKKDWLNNSKSFDFIKTGPYIEDFGPLTSPKTNQRFYARGGMLDKLDASNHIFYDVTDKFWK